jgi:hypothetical protein
MNITLRLEGIPERIVEKMINMGIAATKTEAVRIAILDYDEHHLKNLQVIEKQELEVDSKLQLSGWKEYLEDKEEDAAWNKYL